MNRTRRGQGRDRRGAARTVPFALLGFGFLLLLEICAPGRSGAFRIGKLDVEPQLDLEGMYDDNVWLRDAGDPQAPVVGDWEGRLRPGLSLLYDQGVTDFLASYLTEFVFYTGPKSPLDVDRTRPDSYAENHNVDLTVLHRFGPRTSLEFTNSTRIGTNAADLVGGDPQAVGASGILPGPSDYRLTGSALEVTRDLTRRVSLSTGGTFRYNWYGEVSSQGVVTQPVREEYYGDLFATCSYDWHPRNTVSFTLRGAYLNFGPRGESKFLTVLLGDAWQITEWFSVSLNAGAQVLDQLLEDQALVPIRATYVNPTGDAALLVRFRDVELGLTGSAGFQDSSGVAETVVSRLGLLRAAWDPLPDWGLEAFGQYSKDEAVFTEQGIEVESFQGGGSVFYAVAAWVRAGFLYRYIDQRDLSSRGSSYKDNRFILSVILALPESSG